jgi:hypothetical protein
LSRRKISFALLIGDRLADPFPLDGQNFRFGEEKRGDRGMTTITTKDGTQIYYNDWGSGQPAVFGHGWPLSADACEDQMFFLAANGFRCVALARQRYGHLRR